MTQVKKNRALIDLTDLAGVKTGDSLYAMDGTRRTALMKVLKVSGKRGLVQILKGNAVEGAGVTLGAKASGSGSSGKRGSAPAKTGKSAGVLFGILQTSMAASLRGGSGITTYNVDAKLSGSSFGLTGYYDYPLANRLQLRVVGGYEQLGATGKIDTTDCTGSSTCTFNVNYLSMYGHGKYTFFDNRRSRAYATAGYGFLIAMSKTSSVVRTEQITTNQIVSLGLGADFSLARKGYIPVNLEYGMFPTSDTVKATILSIRVGYGWLL